MCYSGGKDSDVIRILADIAGVKHELHHNLTTVDAPETIRYIKSIPNVSIDLARDKDGKQVTMWNLIEHKGMPPTRFVRYCCDKLKEGWGKGRLKVTGVRWAESVKRKTGGALVNVHKTVRARKKADAVGAEYDENKYGIVLNTDNDANRRFVEQCYRTDMTLLNPIIDWTDNDVWEFLHHYGCESNPLYQCGWKRIGCIGCPMKGSKGQKADFEAYPKYRDAYIRAFERMLMRCHEQGKAMDWQTGEDVMAWWLGEDPNQMTLAQFLSEEQKDDRTLYVRAVRHIQARVPKARH